MSVEHHTITVERDYFHPLAKVFGAWADPEVKIRWFDLTDAPDTRWFSDFRIGGYEELTTGPSRHPALRYRSYFVDIEIGERIVALTETSIDGRCASALTLTVEFFPTRDGTRLRCTELGAFLDGREDPTSRRTGLSAQLDRLTTTLA